MGGDVSEERIRKSGLVDLSVIAFAGEIGLRSPVLLSAVVIEVLGEGRVEGRAFVGLSVIRLAGKRWHFLSLKQGGLCRQGVEDSKQSLRADDISVVSIAKWCQLQQVQLPQILLTRHPFVMYPCFCISVNRFWTRSNTMPKSTVNAWSLSPSIQRNLWWMYPLLPRPKCGAGGDGWSQQSSSSKSKSNML